MNTLSAVQGRDFSLLGQALMRQIERMPKPVIARVNGFALGGGLELAMACHLRIAADTAKVGQPEINLGLIPGFGSSQRLLRLCGRAATLELCLLG
ncbi:enoyl-CoA hydratase, partial [Mesorhizobium sp. M4B.F.Ca.ET.203.01.1.1]